MAVDLSNLAAAQVATESDVEQKVIWPLLTAVEWLNIPESSIRTKSYLPLTTIDKGSGRKIGYYPDYAVWLEGLPVLIVEAKTPLENAIEGFREAELYAHELNKAYPSGINPLSLVLSTNGKVVIFGPWDGKPAGSLQIQDLQIGTSAHHELKEYLGFPILAKAATTARSRFRPAQAFRPIDSIGGDRTLLRRIGYNSFATDLVPLIRMFFVSDTAERLDQIIERAYVSSDEITKYDQILETFLRERIHDVRNPGLKR